MKFKYITEFIGKIIPIAGIKTPGKIKPLYLYLIAASVVIVVAGIILIFSGNKNHVEFLPYTSNQGGFTIDAPGGEMVVKNESVKFLDKTVVQFSHEASLPESEFRVVHFDLPAGMINPQERSNILNHLAASYIQPINGVITNTQDFSIQSYDGIRISAEGEVNDTAMVSEAIILLVSNRIYMAGVHGKEKGVRKKQVNSFISSFKFNF